MAMYWLPVVLQIVGLCFANRQPWPINTGRTGQCCGHLKTNADSDVAFLQCIKELPSLPTRETGAGSLNGGSEDGMNPSLRVQFITYAHAGSCDHCDRFVDNYAPYAVALNRAYCEHSGCGFVAFNGSYFDGEGAKGMRSLGTEDQRWVKVRLLSDMLQTTTDDWVVWIGSCCICVFCCIILSCLPVRVMQC